MNASYGQAFHQVGKILIHKKYRREVRKNKKLSSSSAPVLLNNAAIIRLRGNGIHYHHSIKDGKEGFSLTRPICLPSKTFFNDAIIENNHHSINATVCKITSYGQNSEDNSYAKYLMGVSSTILSNNDCMGVLRRVTESPFYRQYKRKLPPSHFCSKGNPQHRSLHEIAGTCNGELGSPLTTVNGAVIQLGIGTWNMGCRSNSGQDSQNNISKRTKTAVISTLLCVISCQTWPSSRSIVISFRRCFLFLCLTCAS